MSTITLTPAKLRQLLGEAAQQGAKVALQQQQPHHHKKIVTVDEYDDDVPKVAKKKTPVKAAAKTTCWAPLRTEGEVCTKAPAHKDGLCGTHHNMKLRGEEFGPKPTKELNPICIATTKKVRLSFFAAG
jgi:hypothetical protein